MSDYWSRRAVVVTGASGYLGKPLCAALKQRGANVIPYTREYNDLRYMHDFLSYASHIDTVYHLAADVGGIGDNIKRPAELFYNNVLLNTNVVNGAAHAKNGVSKFIALGSSCAYPSDAPLPFTESDYLKGEPEPTNAPYAYSKRLLLTHLQAAHTQYGLNYTYLILANLYGEGCGTDPEKAHVIGALVRKFYEAKQSGTRKISLWGHPYTVRDFLHVDDAVSALLMAGEREATGEVFNVGTGIEYTIWGIANSIAYFTGYTGSIAWDTGKPQGSGKRVLDTSRLDPVWKNHKGLSSALKEMVAWYASTQQEVSPA